MCLENYFWITLQRNFGGYFFKILIKVCFSCKKYMQEAKAKNTQFGDMALESTQTGFIQKLLKECKQKVKVHLNS